MEEFSNCQLGAGFEKQEMSLTMKYLLENPVLLQPPESEKKDKCKDDKLQDMCDTFDQPSAYLGPQIWDDLLQSDDLKLEPVCVDDLLDGGIEDEFADFNMMLSKGKSPGDSALTEPTGADSAYCDMPPLGSEYSPEATEIPSPTQFLNVQPNQPDAFSGVQPVVLPGANDPAARGFGPMHPNPQQALCDIAQSAVLADIVCNQNNGDQFSFNYPANPLGPPMPPQPRSNQVSMVKNAARPLNTFEVPMAPRRDFPPPRDEVKVCDIAEKRSAKGDGSPTALSPLTPINVCIPSPVRVDFIANQADVLISTPEDVSAKTSEAFDPATRRFTQEELKPQPIVRKSRKVFVAPEGKDDKYWSRRTKNNAAAKRSREARRIKENQISMRANYLEQENVSLKTEVAQLRAELERIINVVKKYEKHCRTPLGKDSPDAAPP